MSNKIRILFYGDSIMDVDKNRENKLDLGSGFPKILSHKLRKTFPDFEFEFYNTAVGGQTVEDLNNRINEDCINLEPDLVILLIGINDVWNNQYAESFGSVKEQKRFQKEYEKLLRALKNKNIKVLVLDPYVLSYPTKRLKWRKDLNPKIGIIHELVYENGFSHIPLDKILNEKISAKKAIEYTGIDGVHPTPKCHILLAEIIFEKLENILQK